MLAVMGELDGVLGMLAAFGQDADHVDLAPAFLHHLTKVCIGRDLMPNGELVRRAGLTSLTATSRAFASCSFAKISE